MADSDGYALFEKLRALGLNEETGADPDMVLVNEFDLQVEPYCEWLRVHRSGKAVIAWLDGTDPQTVIATPGWSFEEGSGLQHERENDAELEFRRVDDSGIEVYFDKRRDCEVYVARQSPSAGALEWRFQKATERMRRHWRQPGAAKVSGSKADEVRAAIADLNIVISHAPDSWQTHFFIGKGWHPSDGSTARSRTSNRGRRASDSDVTPDRPAAPLHRRVSIWSMDAEAWKT